MIIYTVHQLSLQYNNEKEELVYRSLSGPIEQVAKGTEVYRI